MLTSRLWRDGRIYGAYGEEIKYVKYNARKSLQIVVLVQIGGSIIKNDVFFFI